MKNNFTLLALVFILLTQNLAAATESEVLFVVMGGRTSCGSASPEPVGSALYRPFMGMLDRLKKTFPRKKFHYLVSCFNADAPPKGEVVYIQSDDPEKTQAADGDTLLNQIEMISATKADLTIFVMGHSYGGWLGMYLAQNHRLPKTLAGLFTIDPISPACGPSGFLTGAAACREAPRDLDNELIKKQSSLWTNLYQEDDRWLHSSAINEADNIKITYRGHHSDINKDQRTWNAIHAQVTKVIGRRNN